MKNLILPLLLTITSAVFAQTKPKQHVYYDTVKTVKTHVDYSPDTIPVYFKELTIGRPKIYHTETGYAIPNEDTIEIQEKWQKGFVIWQTYHKGTGSLEWNTGVTTLTDGRYLTLTPPDSFYKTEYDDFTKTAPGVFLYRDRKTRVTNKVLSVIKQ